MHAAAMSSGEANPLAPKTFWFVWNEDGNTPRHKHYTEAAATQEAERLARAHPGQAFVVLESKKLRKVDGMIRENYVPELTVTDRAFFVTGAAGLLR